MSDSRLTPTVSAVLAILGGVAGLIALLLPWYVVHLDGFIEQMKEFTLKVDGMIDFGVTPSTTVESLDPAARLALEGMRQGYQESFVGFRVWGMPTAVIGGMAALAAIYVGVQLLRGRGGRQPGPLLAVLALAIGLRAAYSLVNLPDQAWRYSFRDNIVLMTHGPGLYVAVASALLLFGAAALEGRGDTGVSPRRTSVAEGSGSASYMPTNTI